MGGNILEKRKNESTYQYIKRIVQAKDTRELDLDYSELAPHLFNKDYSSDVARRMFYGLRYLISIIESEGLTLQPTSQLNEIQRQLGELDVKRQEIKNKYGKFNQIKKQLIKTIEISNDIKDLLYTLDFPTFEQYPLVHSNNKIIICLSDIHVGYILKDYKGNNYNYFIAQERIAKVIQILKRYCKMYDVSDVVVINNGDIIENSYMRENQSYDTEFTLSEQIVNATKLIFSTLNTISEFANVEFYSVGGNHCRMNSLKSANIEGDNANVVVNETLKTFVDLSMNKRIHINDIDYKDDSVAFKVNTVNVKVIHGDNRVKNEKRLFDSEATIDKTFYDLILRGHWHSFNVSSQNGGYVVTTGSLIGGNPYSVKTIGAMTNPCQTLCIIDNNGVELIKNIELEMS